MMNLAKCVAAAALAVGLGVAASKPASAWIYEPWGYSCGDGCGYGYGAFGPVPYGFYPYGLDGPPVGGPLHQPEASAKAQASRARPCLRAECGKPARPAR